MHRPEHGTLQQVLSTHAPLAHWLSAVQELPGARLAVHLPSELQK